MKLVVALCTLSLGLTQPTLAEDDGAPKAPAPASPGERNTAAQPPAHGSPKTPAAAAHEKERARDVAPPEHDEAPDASDPYARDPYETEPSGEDEAGTGDHAGPKLDEPSASAAHEPDDPYAVHEDDTEPDDAAED